jgi:hypothetical protein
MTGARHVPVGVLPADGALEPQQVPEIIALRWTLKMGGHRHVLAYFERRGNRPTEAICRLEHLRGSAFGIRSLNDCIARSLLEARRLKSPATPCIVRAP